MENTAQIPDKVKCLFGIHTWLNVGWEPLTKMKIYSCSYCKQRKLVAEDGAERYYELGPSSSTTDSRTRIFNERNRNSR